MSLTRRGALFTRLGLVGTVSALRQDRRKSFGVSVVRFARTLITGLPVLDSELHEITFAGVLRTLTTWGSGLPRDPTGGFLSTYLRDTGALGLRAQPSRGRKGMALVTGVFKRRGLFPPGVAAFTVGGRRGGS